MQGTKAFALNIVTQDVEGIADFRVALRRTAVRRAALARLQTCYGREPDLQAVAPFKEQWQGNPALVRGIPPAFAPSMRE